MRLASRNNRTTHVWSTCEQPALSNHTLRNWPVARTRTNATATRSDYSLRLKSAATRGAPRPPSHYAPPSVPFVSRIRIARGWDDEAGEQETKTKAGEQETKTK